MPASDGNDGFESFSLWRTRSPMGPITVAQVAVCRCPLERTAVGCRSALLRLIVVLNEKFARSGGDDVTQEQAFAHANDVLKNAVGGDPTTAATSSTSRVSSTSTLKT